MKTNQDEAVSGSLKRSIY